MQVLAYARVMDAEDAEQQYKALREYACHHHLHIDAYLSVRLHMLVKLEPLTLLSPGDMLLITGLCSLGRSTLQVLERVHQLLTGHVRLIVLKEGLDLHLQNPETQRLTDWCAQLVDLERAFICSRTQAGLGARREQGGQLGKPRGTLQASKFDEDRARIDAFLAAGMSGRKIARKLGYVNAAGLNKYIRKHDLRRLETKVIQENVSAKSGQSLPVFEPFAGC